MREVTFTDIGEGMTEGEILHYFVEKGDKVSADQSLVEIQTDKMIAEVPAPAAGTVQSIRFDSGEVVMVGEVLLEIDTGEKNFSPSSIDQNSGASEERVSPTEEEITGASPPLPPFRVKAAPHTRRIARELNVDIEKIEGTGPSGRIIDDDVYRFAENDTTSDDDNETSATPVTSSGGRQATEAKDIPFTGIRKQTAIKMSESWKTIPHVTHFDEADMTRLLEFHKELKQLDERISIPAFFMKASVIALKEYKVFNAQLDEENEVIRLAENYHIGFATHTDGGLMVPVIHDADGKSIKAMDAEMKTLTEKAQKGNLGLTDMKNGTFTVNNVGPLGGIGATPIINKPETGIISFHKTKKKPVVIENDEIAVRSVMTISFSFDHRVADGALAIEFVNRFIGLIESPEKLFLELV